VHTIHGFGFHQHTPPLKRAAFISLEIVAAQVTDAFISVSRANIAEAQALGIIRDVRDVRLIRSGFDVRELEDVAEKKAEMRAALGLGLRAEDEVIVCIANLKPQKDPLTLVEAMRLLAMKRPRAILLYAGDGELRPRVEEAIRQTNLEGRFRLIGWRTDVPALIGAADVVALSSVFEGLPRSAVQALAGKRPFVGTRVDGTAEIIRDGRNGYLVEPRSPEKLAEALAKALVERAIDPNDRERVREWDAVRMVEEQEALYQKLASD
jgi:glycosyltransferase involved in cell wall biosynthesis